MLYSKPPESTFEKSFWAIAEPPKSAMAQSKRLSDSNFSATTMLTLSLAFPDTTETNADEVRYDALDCADCCHLRAAAPPCADGDERFEAPTKKCAINETIAATMMAEMPARKKNGIIGMNAPTAVDNAPETVEPSACSVLLLSC